jgi:hypothetical protein
MHRMKCITICLISHWLCFVCGSSWFQFPGLRSATLAEVFRVFLTEAETAPQIRPRPFRSRGSVVGIGRAVAQRLDAGFPSRLPGFAYGQHVGFVVDKAALGQVCSEYFGFPRQSFHRFLHDHNHPGLTQ